MKELEMIKAFAELEGVKTHTYRTRFTGNTRLFINNSTVPTEYNPITDLALNCAARDKYKASVTYPSNGNLGRVQILKDHGYYTSYFEDYPAITVIECILKSEGLYE